MESLYIHIPFCEKICTYCDFAKEVSKPFKRDRYLAALEKELEAHAERLKDLRTIFIGGGTPSILSPTQFDRLGGMLKRHIPMPDIEEFTVECNPSDINPDLAQKLIHIGVNRISIGIQTFNDEHLAFLNRTHRSQDIARAVRTLRDAGFENISADMLFGLPSQTMDALHDDMNQLLKLNVDHISYYNLILEEGTRLHTLYKKGAVELPDEDKEADMYETVIRRLKDSGYAHYEISNFAKAGKEAIHNVRIWKDADYLGIGAGAHSKYGATRYGNVRRVTRYIDTVLQDPSTVREAYPYEPVRDYMLNGLRLLEGISLNDFKIRFNKNVFDVYPSFKRMVEEGFLEQTDGRLHLTHKGLMYGNAIFQMV